MPGTEQAREGAAIAATNKLAELASARLAAIRPYVRVNNVIATAEDASAGGKNHVVDLEIANWGPGPALSVHGEIKSLTGQGAVMSWGNSGTMLLPPGGFLSTGTSVDVAFKRHSVRLMPMDDGGPASGQAKGEVKRIYFLGQADEVCVDLDGQEIFAFTAPRQFAVGAPVAIHIDPAAYQIFPRQPVSSSAE